MYGYYNNIPVFNHPSELLTFIRSIPQLLIFKHIFKEEILIDGEKLYCSPFRNDNNPRCKFSLYSGVYYFVDFTQKNPNTNCIDALKKYYKISFQQAIVRCVDILNNNNIYFNYVPSVNSSVISKIKQDKNIFYKERVFNSKDMLFWKNKYNISKEQLQEDGVKAISEFSFYSAKLNQRIGVKPSDITYVYTDFKDNGVKIYRPFSKEGKWTTNLSKNQIGGINKTEQKECIIITKSYKDYRVLKNNIKNIDIIWLQNEGMFPEDSYLYFLKYYKHVIIFFDNDTTGIKASGHLKEHLKSIFNLSSISIFTLPRHYSKISITDISDYICVKKQNKTKQLLLRLKIKTWKIVKTITV
jgi:5S rRNA maturation endonuclease (ribonuclease M5)